MSHPEKSAARLAPAADSLGTALERADLAAVVKVVSVRTEGITQSATLETVAVMKGDVQALAVLSDLATSGQRRPESCYFETGERVFTLLTRSSRGWSCTPHTPFAHVPVPDAAMVQQIRDLMAVYLRVADDPESRQTFKTGLWQHLVIGSAHLRRGVLYDLGQVLTRNDLTRLRHTLMDTKAPDDVRAWAVRGIGRIGAYPYPSELLQVLDHPVGVIVRQAVMQVYGQRRNADDLAVLERGLQDTDASVRTVAVESFAVPQMVPVLMSHFRTETDRGVQLAIVRKFGELDTAQARRLLASICTNANDPGLRQEARQVLPPTQECD